MKMYCPKCQKLFDEPLDNVNKCPDCMFSRLREPKSDDPALLARLNFTQANMLKPILEDMGIPCLVKGGLADAFAMGIGLKLDEIKVYVPYSAYETASDALEGFLNYNNDEIKTEEDEE